MSTTTSRAFRHYSLGGELLEEDVDVVSSEVVSVTCRWCGNGHAVESIGADGAAADAR